ncbi:hypothetical protein WJX82_010566 [Trebouxia sp. C0006]
MEGSMDALDTINSELRKRKIEKRDQRGYAAGPIAWQSHKRQKFHCRKCKRSFPRMEILLQHFRDCSRHSGEAVSAEASVQMADWLLAKDQKQHCCPTCCLGFKTEPELFVHLKHIAVHQGTSEAQQATALLLPKDEARLMRRELQGSAADPVVKTGEQLSQDNAQTEAVLDRTRDGTSVGLAESGSTLPEASLRPLQRRVVAKKRRRLTLLFTSNPISVQEDKSESTLAGTDNVEMAIIEPQTSNQTDIHDAGKRSRKEKKLARRESRPVKISWHPNKITFAFG